MLRTGVTKVDAILFTHEHADHTAGLDDVRPISFKHGKIPIFAHERVIQNLSKRFDYLFDVKNDYPKKSLDDPRAYYNSCKSFTINTKLKCRLT